MPIIAHNVAETRNVKPMQIPVMGSAKSALEQAFIPSPMSANDVGAMESVKDAAAMVHVRFAKNRAVNLLVQRAQQTHAADPPASHQICMRNFDACLEGG